MWAVGCPLAPRSHADSSRHPRHRRDSVPTRKRVSRWERSVVWAILRNPRCQGRKPASGSLVGNRPSHWRGLHALTRRRQLRVNGSRAPFDYAAALRHVSAPSKTGHERNGSRYRCRPSSLASSTSYALRRVGIAPCSFSKRVMPPKPKPRTVYCS
jgi:hypothetical protein